MYQNTAARSDIVSTNKTLQQVYRLLAMNMATSSIAAVVAMSLNIGRGMSLIMTIAAFILLFVIGKKANKASGVMLTFLFTGLLGASLGPTLNHYINMTGGVEIIAQALGLTAVIFFGLSAYVLARPEKDFSAMGSFLMVGLIAVIVAAIANIFLAIPAMSLAISGVIAVLMSGFIIYDTSRIVREQPNYVLATVSMYLNILNLFTAILHILGFMSSDD